LRFAAVSSPLLVLSTCPDAETAGRIARALIAERLAACVNRVPGIASTYRWRGEILDDAEVLLMIKTTRDRFETLRARLVELHPYDVPEVIALDIASGHAPYLDWLAAETEAHPDAGKRGGHLRQ
jgi:periplasmic divalent cation tolerance protein